ncbi:MAG: acyl-CoA dehydrogenase [Pseudomonadota bacterium]
MDFIPRDEIDFLLNTWLGVAELTDRPAYQEHSTGTFDAVLDLAADLARDHFAPHYKQSDAVEPALQNGVVALIPEMGAALEVYAEAGFFASAFPEDMGGMQLPHCVSTAAFAHFCAANIATSAYPMLTGGNARLLLECASPAQIHAWAKPQIAGRFFGTMCLSEPQAGSSLADIRTHATPDGEDDLGPRYRLRGNKMWISGGDHELSENIVHLVLAKAPAEDGNTAAGTKGISLFAVPKWLPDGSRNDISVAGLNHKMGYRGTVNCLLNFGESHGALGWRIGAIGAGLPNMFRMMNEARIMVGLGAATLAYRGYTQSLDYARARPQGRTKATARDPATPMVPIIEHADVKRMLIAQKAFAEGALALVLYSARLVDDIKSHPDAGARQDAEQLLSLLTPITKSWPSEFGLAANDLAIQIHGGYGYTRDYDVEQVYRDNRLNPIHEGTHGIQGLDFLGRKIIADKGNSLGLLTRRITHTVNSARQQPELTRFADQLDATLEHAITALTRLTEATDSDRLLDNASLALSAFGHIVIAWLWLDQAVAAAKLVDTKAEKRSIKLATCRYFFECELPKALHLLQLVAEGNDAASAICSDLL